MNFQKILCTTDFSDASYEAIEGAVDIAKAFSSEIHLLHVVAPLPSVASHIAPAGFNMSLYQDEMEKKAWQLIKTLVDERYPGAGITVHVEQGDPANRISHFARENDIDLIVISSHGQSGLAALFGSTADKVIRHAGVPVLTVPVQQKSG
jgi:nucleotide-binding universal stress UspA family protein